MKSCQKGTWSWSRSLSRRALENPEGRFSGPTDYGSAILRISTLINFITYRFLRRGGGTQSASPQLSTTCESRWMISCEGARAKLHRLSPTDECEISQQVAILILHILESTGSFLLRVQPFLCWQKPAWSLSRLLCSNWPTKVSKIRFSPPALR